MTLEKRLEEAQRHERQCRLFLASLEVEDGPGGQVWCVNVAMEGEGEFAVPVQTMSCLVYPTCMERLAELVRQSLTNYRSEITRLENKLRKEGADAEV